MLIQLVYKPMNNMTENKNIRPWRDQSRFMCISRINEFDKLSAKLHKYCLEKKDKYKSIFLIKLELIKGNNLFKEFEYEIFDDICYITLRLKDTQNKNELINNKIKEIINIYKPSKIEIDSFNNISTYKSIVINNENLIRVNYDEINIAKEIKNKLPIVKKLRFLSILDEFSEASWGKVLTLYQLTRINYQNQILGSTAHALFLESCWNGNNGNWNYAFTSPELKHKNAQDLLNAISIAKNKMPILFWNKEDPMHYQKFLPIASLCDVIFTTDNRMLDKYKRDIPDAIIEVLPFATSPELCNPLGRFAQKDVGTICFAGSYYAKDHEERKVQMDSVLPIIINLDGIIYDRMSNQKSDRYKFPNEYIKHIRPAVPFSDITTVYKKFKLFLNVNTIVESETMMSRRVYELLSSGTPVISTPSKAIDAQFDGIVQVASDARGAGLIAKSLLNDHWKWLRLSHLGYREVMLKHTYKQRMHKIANKLGYELSAIDGENDMVSIITASNRPHFIDRIASNITKQTYSNLELIIVVQNYSERHCVELENKIKQLRPSMQLKLIINNSNDSLGKRLNSAVELAAGHYVAKMDDDDFYFPNYLLDMLIPFSFSGCAIVGKEEIFMYMDGMDKTLLRYKGKRHKFTQFVAGATLVMKREIFKKVKFGDLNTGEDGSLIKMALDNGLKIYASDPFNFSVYRDARPENHTWKIDQDFFVSKSEFIALGKAENIIAI